MVKITKGTKVIVEHKRKGSFNAVAYADFDPEKDGFYPLTLDQHYLDGESGAWIEGMEIRVSKSLCSVRERVV